jgi:hypothetical protein
MSEEVTFLAYEWLFYLYSLVTSGSYLIYQPLLQAAGIVHLAIERKANGVSYPWFQFN